MYQRIILAYDGSREGRMALREGAVLAQRCRSRVFLLAIDIGGTGIQVADAVSGWSAAKRQRMEFQAILDEGVAV